MSTSFPKPAVRLERTHWRDEELSARHRRWGWDCPAIDLDFLMMEYDQGKATALVEYKHETAPPQRRSHPSYQALIDIGNRAQMPVFGVRYAGDFSWFRVTPLNPFARKWLDVQSEMGEQDYVKLLYRIRGRELPLGFFDDWDVEL